MVHLSLSECSWAGRRGARARGGESGTKLLCKVMRDKHLVWMGRMPGFRCSLGLLKSLLCKAPCLQNSQVLILQSYAGQWSPAHSMPRRSHSTAQLAQVRTTDSNHAGGRRLAPQDTPHASRNVPSAALPPTFLEISVKWGFKVVAGV